VRKGNLGAQEVANFNARCVVGQRVELLNDHGKVEHTKTTSEAWLLGGHTPVVKVEGRSGCYLLNRITPIKPLEDGVV
jgi:hypothetical protein